MRYRFSILVLAICVHEILSGQGTCLEGKVVNEKDEILPLAAIQVFYRGNFFQGGITDFDGKFRFCELPKGEDVDIQVDYTGYMTFKLAGVPVGSDSVVLEVSRGGHFCAIEVMSICVPIIEQDDLTSGQRFTADQIRRQPSGNSSIACPICRKEDRKAKREARRERRRQRRVGGSS